MEEHTPAPQPISLGDLIVNVFTSPSEAFEGLRTSPSRVGVWLLPLIILIIMGSLFTVVMFSDDTLREQFQQSQEQVMQQRVDEGKMTQEQADQALDQMEKMGGMFMAFGIIGSVVFISLMFFGAALVLWLVGKLAWKSPAKYGKYLEVYGTSSWIGALGFIVTLLMILAMGSIYASPSAALAIFSHFDATDTSHRVLASINVFSIWQAVVVGIGISKLSEKPIGPGIAVALVLWVIWVAVSVLLGFAR